MSMHEYINSKLFREIYVVMLIHVISSAHNRIQNFLIQSCVEKEPIKSWQFLLRHSLKCSQLNFVYDQKYPLDSNENSRILE